MKFYLITLLFLAAFAGCSDNQSTKNNHGTWLQGDQQHFAEAIERQFDGFSRTMMEVQYRYEELYWAGQDENWEYADYQLEHIFEAIEKGYERRPERKDNSLEFLKAPHDLMQQAIDARELELFNRNFFIYKKACMSCHIKEDVEFINIIIPEFRRGITRSDKN